MAANDISGLILSGVVGAVGAVVLGEALRFLWCLACAPEKVYRASQDRVESLTKQLAIERARVRQELLAEISMLFSQESTIVEDDLRLIMDCVCPPEEP